jgi:hypothetical protein
MPSPIVSHVDAVSPALKTALDERRPILLAMSDADVDRQPKVDAYVAAEAVIGVAPRIAEQRDAIVAQFGAPAGALVDDLVAAARATMQADAELNAAAAIGDLTPMEVELRAEHTLLMTDAQSLANRRLINAQRLEAGRGTLSYRQLIQSTIALIALLREHWPTIVGHTPITEEDLARIETKALQMATALGERDKGSTRVPAAELRLRALSALVRQYDKVRRMVTYLRWDEGDADDIAPSLYTRRPGRRAPDDAEEPTPATPSAPVVTAPASPVVSATGVPLSPFVS